LFARRKSSYSCEKIFPKKFLLPSRRIQKIERFFGERPHQRLVAFAQPASVFSMKHLEPATPASQLLLPSRRIQKIARACPTKKFTKKSQEKLCFLAFFLRKSRENLFIKRCFQIFFLQESVDFLQKIFLQESVDFLQTWGGRF
jgi:hypothetical protein